MCVLTELNTQLTSAMLLLKLVVGTSLRAITIIITILFATVMLFIITTILLGTTVIICATMATIWATTVI